LDTPENAGAVVQPTDTMAPASTESVIVPPREDTLPGGVFYRHWPSEDARAVILLVHGLGEHSGRYQYFADYCSQFHIAVVAPDHVGHGRSPGHRCHVGRFSDYTAPLDELRALIDEWYPGRPCFIVGHSMGGLITARYLLDRQSRFLGAALSGAALAVEEPPGAIAIFINRLISLVLPKLGVMQLDPAQVSRDPEVVRKYIEDPLVHSGKISARLVTELFDTMAEVRERRASITLPLLVMHGDRDVMTAVQGSRDFVAGVGSTDSNLIVYPGLFHEIFNEPEKDQVLKDLCDWIAAHGGGAGEDDV
jgi:alpha-beta hydrolase superfamily lysophospholipase